MLCWSAMKEKIREEIREFDGGLDDARIINAPHS